MKDFCTGSSLQQFLIWVKPEPAPALGAISLKRAICPEQIQAKKNTKHFEMKTKLAFF